jgi:hypothetical protein
MYGPKLQRLDVTRQPAVALQGLPPSLDARLIPSFHSRHTTVTVDKGIVPKSGGTSANWGLGHAL